MPDEQEQVASDERPDALERFQKFARALFRVDKRDVKEHETKKRAKKRAPRSSALPND